MLYIKVLVTTREAEINSLSAANPEMILEFRYLEVDKVGAGRGEKEGVGVAEGSIHLIATQDVDVEAAGDEDYRNLGRICQTFHRTRPCTWSLSKPYTL
jgi:hypothetical protein